MFLLFVISPDSGVTSRPERSSYRRYLLIYIYIYIYGCKQDHVGYTGRSVLKGLNTQKALKICVWNHKEHRLKAIIISSSLTQTPQVPGFCFCLFFYMKLNTAVGWNHFSSIRKTPRKSTNQTQRHISGVLHPEKIGGKTQFLQDSRPWDEFIIIHLHYCSSFCVGNCSPTFTSTRLDVQTTSPPVSLLD